MLISCQHPQPLITVCCFDRKCKYPDLEKWVNKLPQQSQQALYHKVAQDIYKLGTAVNVERGFDWLK